MQLTKHTDYGFRILIYLALLPKDERCNIDEISEKYAISRNNVNKIVHLFGKENIIVTKRGKGGGFSLAKQPDDIRLGEIVRLLEQTLEIVDCHTPYCVITPACKLKPFLVEATNAFLAVLDKYTLQDILEDQTHALKDLLKITIVA